jgi:hypothetical protein
MRVTEREGRSDTKEDHQMAEKIGTRQKATAAKRAAAADTKGHGVKSKGIPRSKAAAKADTAGHGVKSKGIPRSKAAAKADTTGHVASRMKAASSKKAAPSHNR